MPSTDAVAPTPVPAMRCAFGAEPTVEAYIWHTLLALRGCGACCGTMGCAGGS